MRASISPAAAATLPAPVPLTAKAAVSASSAPSTSVQAAQLMTTSGRSRSNFLSSPTGSVTSSSGRPKPTTSWPALPAASITSRPSIPAAPVTRTFTRQLPLDDFDLGIVPDEQAQRLRHAVAAGQLDVAPEQARLH